MAFKKKFCLISLLGLTACVGTFVSGEEALQGGKIPDLRTVPCREEAMAPRGWHGVADGGDEAASREEDASDLTKMHETLEARERTLRARIGQLKQKDGAL